MRAPSPRSCWVPPSSPATRVSPITLLPHPAISPPALSLLQTNGPTAALPVPKSTALPSRPSPRAAGNTAAPLPSRISHPGPAQPSPAPSLTPGVQSGLPLAGSHGGGLHLRAGGWEPRRPQTGLQEGTGSLALSASVSPSDSKSS